MSRRFSVHPDLASTVQAAADHVLEVLSAAIEERGVARIALSGGSTPAHLYRVLAARPDALDWTAVRFAWSDERVVASQDPASNIRLARAELLDPLSVGEDHVVAPLAELGAVDAAARYEIDLRTVFGEVAPRFDLILLGMGSDGHTASLFPGGPELDVPDSRLVVNSTAPFDPPERVSFTLPLINAARHVVFLALGESKAAMVARVRGDDRSLPAARVMGEDVVWFVDQAADGRD